MREHPIPQDIVGYKFHIVGNMTIKQFAEVAVGVFIAFLFYQTNLFAPIKWSLIGLSFASGALLAFVPFEERPLDHWLFTFISVLYKPTKYFWQRQAKIPDAFLYQQRSDLKNTEPEIDLSPARRQRIKEYLASVNNPSEIDQDELARHQLINQILNSFNQVTIKYQDVQRDLDHKPDLKVRVRSLGVHSTVATTGGEVIEERAVDQYEEVERTRVELRTPLSVSQVATDIAVPEMEQLQVGSPIDVEAATSQTQQAQDQGAYAYVENVATDQAIDPLLAQNATFNQSLPFPSKPTEPNKLVGMVLTPHNDLVNDAIVEIKAGNGSTVRAVKTNALGQFFVTTPLPDGDYTLEIDRSDLSFQPLQLTLVGKPVDPIEIRSIV